MDNQEPSNNSGQQQNDSGSDAKQNIKRRALGALIPLIDQLEESPERKFEIVMTAVRSAEEESLLDKALETALKIEDPTAKADALLEVINEASFQEQK